VARARVGKVPRAATMTCAKCECGHGSRPIQMTGHERHGPYLARIKCRIKLVHAFLFCVSCRVFLVGLGFFQVGRFLGQKSWPARTCELLRLRVKKRIVPICCTGQVGPG
jgi:hypothetical protein